jgi:hypothetical protein
MRKPKLLLVLLLVLPLTALASDLTPDEAAVWQLEAAYWQYVKANDLEAYRTLWDENFVGWPSFSERPLGKASIGDWIPPLHEDPERLFDYRLQPEAVRAFGDSVVAHYLVWEYWRDAATGAVVEEDPPIRITHTWQRRGDTWQIITGMSASYDH